MCGSAVRPLVARIGGETAAAFISVIVSCASAFSAGVGRDEDARAGSFELRASLVSWLGRRTRLRPAGAASLSAMELNLQRRAAVGSNG